MNRLLVVVGLSLAVCSGAPTTYDQRQDGNLNLAAKLENILIVVALPGSESEGLNSDLSSYLSSTVARTGTKRPLKTAEILPSEAYKLEATEAQDEEDSFAESSEAEKPTDDGDEANPGTKPAAKARQLWNQDQDLTTLKQGTTLKKELSVLDEGPVSQEYERSGNKYQNEVGIIGNHQLTLIGTAIEDCGPERRRNSLGICQPFADD